MLSLGFEKSKDKVSQPLPEWLASVADSAPPFNEVAVFANIIKADSEYTSTVTILFEVVKSKSAPWKKSCAFCHPSPSADVTIFKTSPFVPPVAGSATTSGAAIPESPAKLPAPSVVSKSSKTVWEYPKDITKNVNNNVIFFIIKYFILVHGFSILNYFN